VDPPADEEEPPVPVDPPVDEEPTVPVFTDVEAGKWYEKAVLWAASVGLVQGRGNGIFDPYANINRQEMVTMIYRYEAYLGHDTTARADLSAYTDSGSINKFAQEAMAWAVAAEVIRGTTSTTIAPRNTATRAQVAQVMMNCGY